MLCLPAFQLPQAITHAGVGCGEDASLSESFLLLKVTSTKLTVHQAVVWWYLPLSYHRIPIWGESKLVHVPRNRVTQQPHGLRKAVSVGKPCVRICQSHKLPFIESAVSETPGWRGIRHSPQVAVTPCTVCTKKQNPHHHLHRCKSHTQLCCCDSMVHSCQSPTLNQKNNIWSLQT